MGIIQRQSIKQSVVSYVATGIGALSTIFVYPLNEEIYGLAVFLVGAATFLGPFLSVGVNSLTIRFFPMFEDQERRHHGFLGFLLLGAFCCMLLTSLLTWLMRGPLLEFLSWLRFDVDLFREYGLVIWVLCILIVFSNILTAYTSNFHRIVVPSLFTNLLPKAALPTLVLLFAWGQLQTYEFTLGILAFHLLIVVGLAAYLWRLRQFHLTLKGAVLNRGLLWNMGEYSLFGLLGSLGSVLATRIDTIMVPALMNLTSTGIYGISLFIGNSIEIPSRAIIGIAGPLIAQAWQREDLAEIAMIYTKSSINLFLAGLLVFIGVWISLDDLFRLTSNYDALIQGRMVVLFIGLARLADMLTSVNSQIIGYSKYFRFNLYSVLVLGVLNVYLNYLLIPRMGIAGAALASFCSITFFNLLKVLFIWFRFRMHPFSTGTFKLLAIAALSFFLVDALPDFQHPLLNIGKNSICIGSLYVGLVLLFRVSEDFTQLAKDMLGRMGLR
jgi:O-antigen/teichoic acid export membrane protein